MLLEGILSVAGNPVNLLLIAVGTVVGIIFGAIPGLTATMAVTIFLPMTYTMSPVQGMATLMALYIGGISGGLISSILLNIPGTPASMTTTFDGAPLAAKGEAGKALGVGIVFSFLGTMIGLLMLVVISPFLAGLAIKFGPFEYCALAIFSLSLVVALTGKDLLKGLASAVIGIMLATVGMSSFDSTVRFTFGNPQLIDGFKTLALLIGFFAIPEVLHVAEKVRNPDRLEVKSFKIKGVGFSFREFKSQIGNMIASALIGVGIGILPGIGGGTSSIMSYTFVKNKSKYPEKFGTGVIDGVVATETSNNAAIGGAMIPLLTLGIPGDGTTAILLGSLMVHAISPGPLIFEKNGAFMYGIYTAIFFSAVFMLLFELGGLRGFVKILKLPQEYLMPIILVLCCIGAFGTNNRIFDIWCVLGFGLFSYILSKLKMPLTPLILGFILGPIFEVNLRRAEQYITTSPMEIFAHPIAVVFLLITVVTLVINIRITLKRGSALN